MNETERIDRDKLPWFYRLLLRVPGVKFLEKAQGIFWAIAVPIFLILEFWVTLMLLVLFAFPVNIVLAAIVPTAIFLVFMRLTLERLIRWWNATIAKSGFEWNVEKSTEEYIMLLKKEKEKD